MEKWLPVILICTALFTGYAPKAQAAKSVTEQEVPVKIRGNWAMPDCGNYEEALIITRHYYLRADKNGSQFWFLPVTSKQKDYWVISIEGQKRPVRVEADGVLKIGLPDTPPKKWPAQWDHLGIDGHREYMGCAEIPAILPNPLVRVMEHIDDIAATCRTSLSSACTKLLFDTADENKNHKISLREMKNAATMLASLSVLTENHSVSRTMMDKAVYRALHETDRIATRINASGHEMSYDDFNGFLKKADSPLLQQALKNVSVIVPGFRN